MGRQEVWTVRDGMGEWVSTYHACNDIMTFTREERDAFRTNDADYAARVKTVAQRLYGRKWMGISLLAQEGK